MTGPDDQDGALLAAQTDALYATAVPSILMGAVGGSILASVFMTLPGVDLWLAVVWLLTLGRLALVFGYKRRQRSIDDARIWALRAIVLVGVSGFVWGTGVAWMIQGATEYQVTAATCLTLGAISLTLANVAFWQYHAAFQIPVCLSVAAGMAMTGRPDYVSMAVATLCICVAYFFIAYRLGQSIVRAMRISIENERLAAELAERSVALERLNGELDTLSRTDPLTGLANRREFVARLEDEWARATRTGQPMSLVSIDVDRFKQYNDRYGHSAGDQCLKTVAGVIGRVACRHSDLAARPGGEEFALLLPGTPPGSAAIVAERLRAMVEADSAASELAHSVTVSIGVAAIDPADGETIEKLMRCADEALYRAKAAGRNRVEISAEIPRVSTMPPLVPNRPEADSDRIGLRSS